MRRPRDSSFLGAWFAALVIATLASLAPGDEEIDPWKAQLALLVSREAFEECLQQMQPLPADLEATLHSRYDALLKTYREYTEPLQAEYERLTSDQPPASTSLPGQSAAGRWYDGLDFEQMQNVWHEKQRELERQFHADITAKLTTDAQRRIWLGASRRLLRQRLLPSIQFGRLSLTVVDLCPILDQLTLGPSEARQIDPVRAEYEAAIHGALEIFAGQSSLPAQMSEAARDFEEGEWHRDTPRHRRYFELQQRWERLILTVADIPERFAAPFVAALEPFNAAAFREGLDRAQFPDLFRATPTELACQALLAATSLSSDQHLNVEAELARHQQQLHQLQARLVPAMRQWNRHTLLPTFNDYLRNMIEQEARENGDSSSSDPDSRFPAVDSLRSLMTLERDSCNRLRSLFPTQQHVRLPLKARILLDWPIEVQP